MQPGTSALADALLAGMLATHVRYASLLRCIPALSVFLLQQSLSHIDMLVATQPQEGNLPLSFTVPVTKQPIPVQDL